MKILFFYSLALILVPTFYLCSADSDKLILKSYDLPYCVVINKNVATSNCTWHNEDSDSPKPVRFTQQQITIHSVKSSEPLDDATSAEVNATGSSNHTYLFRINQNLCLVMTNSGMIGTGKCTVRKARFVLRSVYITSRKDANKPEVKTKAYTIELRTSIRNCIGFPRQINFPLAKKPCSYKPENVLGQLWTFCSSDGRCNISPTQSASSVIKSATTEAPKHVQGNTGTGSETGVSAGNGKSISQFLSLAIILHSILALFGNGAN